MGLPLESGTLICIRCRTARSEGWVCPMCEPQPGDAEHDEEEGEAPEWCELSPVFEAPNEIAAISIQAVLEEEGVPAVVRSTLVPNYGAVAMTLAGCWGWVLVPADEAARGRSIVEAYLRSLGDGPSGRTLFPNT